MARPALATVSVLAIVASWNNFMLPLVVFNDPNWWTLPLGVQQFQGQYSADTARVLAYVVLAMVPALGVLLRRRAPAHRRPHCGRDEGLTCSLPVLKDGPASLPPAPGAMQGRPAHLPQG